MKRELKVRVWDGEQMVYLKNSGYSMQTLFFTNHRWNDTGSCRVGNDLDHVDIMFYTGLNDKNGIEIYEGDIVNYTRLTTMMDGLITYKLLIPSLDNHSDWIGIKLHMREIEVVGNIKDTPKLIPPQK